MRRYDLDWLRVIVFGLLILYHVGMFFVPWDYHIKNSITYPEIKWPMLFINQWRLPILFVISGMGTFYAFSKRSGIELAKERLTRLFIPLLAGILFIVPPQVYFERLDKGQFSDGYFNFWPTQAFIGIYPEGNFSWHHLWFLPYLLLYSLILIPVFLYLRKNPDVFLLKIIKRLAVKPSGLFLFIIPLYLWECFLEPFFPSTHALIGDWFNIVNYLTLFFYGFLLVSAKDVFWNNVINNRQKYLYYGIFGFTALIGLRLLFEDSSLIHFIEALLKVFNLWVWILVLFGYSAHYLNKPSPFLFYTNNAVYPFYILHQTITIAIGYYLKNLNLAFFAKFIIMTVGTFAGIWIIYEFGIRRWVWIRPFFGLKKKNNRLY